NDALLRRGTHIAREGAAEDSEAMPSQQTGDDEDHYAEAKSYRSHTERHPQKGQPRDGYRDRRGRAAGVDDHLKRAGVAGAGAPDGRTRGPHYLELGDIGPDDRGRKYGPVRPRKRRRGHRIEICHSWTKGVWNRRRRPRLRADVRGPR